MGKWKGSDIANLKKKGFEVVSTTPGISKEILTITEILKELGLGHELEYCFHNTRKWRFDVWIPELKLGVEYEGVFSDKSRHTTVSGYTGDCDKYNAAAVMGIRVLRYTSKNLGGFRSDITEIKKGSICSPLNG